MISRTSSFLTLKETDGSTQFKFCANRKNNFSTSFKNLNENANNATTPTEANSNASKQELFYVEERSDLGYAIFRLNKRPVNSLNLEFLTALNIQLDKLEQTKNIHGIILTSNMPNIFSAGLDIMVNSLGNFIFHFVLRLLCIYLFRKCIILNQIDSGNSGRLYKISGLNCTVQIKSTLQQLM